MNIVQSIMTNNPCYKAGRKIAVKGLMLHSVGCPQPSAQAFINIFNKSSYNAACVHAFIDANTGTIYQTLPWNHRGWHGGRGTKGCCNDTHIGVEMCEPAQIRYTSGSNFTITNYELARAAVERAYNSAVELFAYLCKQYGLNPLTAICSHKEGCAKGIATNHGDPEHLWRGLSTQYTMDGFRRDVQRKMSGKIESEELSMSQYAELKGSIAVLNDTIKALAEENKALKETNAKIINALGGTMVYNYIDSNMPEWAREAVKAAVACKAVTGVDGKGSLNLSEKDLRTIVREYRRGLYNG